MKRLLKLTITLFLFVFWISTSIIYLYLRDGSLTQVVDKFSYERLNFPSDNQLLSGDKISGEFTASGNFIGGISVGLSGFYRKSADFLTLEIKDKDRDSWIRKSSHEIQANSVGGLREFGFEPIQNSKSNHYYFEITSASSQEGDMVMVDTSYPTLVIKYQYPKSYIFSSPGGFLEFTSSKTNNLVDDKEFQANFFVFSVPLVVYLLLILTKKNLGFVPVLAIVSFVIIDIFFIEERSNFVYVFVFIGWLATILHHRLEARISLLLSFLVFLVTLLLLFTGNDVASQKAGLWCYLFFLTGILEESVDKQGDAKNKVSLSGSWNALIEKLRFAYLALNDNAYTAYRRVNNSSQNTISELTKIRKLFAPIKFLLQRVVNYKKEIVIVLLSGIALLLSLRLVQNLFKYLIFFVDFFPKDQITLFLTRLGIYLLLIQIFAAGLVWRVYPLKRSRPVHFLLIVVMVLVTNLFVSDFVFDIRTTNFRDKILVWSVYPPRATLWDNIIITGRNFRDKPNTGKVFINGVEHRVLTWSDTKITITADPTKTQSGDLIVERVDGTRSTPLGIIYY